MQGIIHTFPIVSICLIAAGAHGPYALIVELLIERRHPLPRWGLFPRPTMRLPLQVSSPLAGAPGRGTVKTPPLFHPFGH